MKLLRVFSLPGPNYWSRRSVIEAWVDLGPELDRPSVDFPGMYERLTDWLPTLIEHRCSLGERGGFLSRLREGTYPGHILEHVTIELQNLSGAPVGFGKARETSTPHVYKVAVRYQVEPLARAALLTAREIVMAAIEDKPFDVAAALVPLRAIADEHALGPSTRAIVAAAEARGIATRRLNAGSLVQLGQGVRQRRLWTAETDRTGAVAEYIAKDKDLTKRLLAEVGVPIPEGRAVTSEDDAWEAANDLGLPVVVKPRDGNHGRAVFVEMRTRAEIGEAFREASLAGDGVIVERFIPGREHRLLVVGRRVVAAARGETAYVTGDGAQTVLGLIKTQLNSDPRRGESDDCPLNLVELDPVSILDLRRQGYTPESIPPIGANVLIQRNGNVAYDVTDDVHPDVAAQVVLAARVVGLDIAGVDVVVEDIGQPLGPQRGAVVEVDSSPGLHTHLRPATGKARPVGEAILELLYPEGENGRIPLVCITGTNGKTSVARLCAALLATRASAVGLACSDGLFVGPRRLSAADSADAGSAQRLLLNPIVDAAIVEAGSVSILNEGLGFDRCQVAVVTNLGEGDHLGRHYIDTPADVFAVKRTPVDMVLPSGAAVLCADDPLVVDMARLCQGEAMLFTQDPDLPALRAHLDSGGRGVTVVDGMLTLLSAGARQPVLQVAELPGARGGAIAHHIDNALAAVTAAWALGLPVEAIAEGLRRAAADPAMLAGRFEVYTVADRTVVVDDCHNPSALAAALRAVRGLGPTRRTAIYAASADRHDTQLERQGELLAEGFDEVILCVEPDEANRPVDDARARLRAGLSRAVRSPQIQERASREFSRRPLENHAPPVEAGSD